MRSMHYQLLKYTRMITITKRKTRTAVLRKKLVMLLRPLFQVLLTPSWFLSLCLLEGVDTWNTRWLQAGQLGVAMQESYCNYFWEIQENAPKKSHFAQKGHDSSGRRTFSLNCGPLFVQNLISWEGFRRRNIVAIAIAITHTPHLQKKPINNISSWPISVYIPTG
jgi:hypothetical protein